VLVEFGAGIVRFLRTTVYKVLDMIPSARMTSIGHTYCLLQGEALG
jgi:hypothetical protein